MVDESLTELVNNLDPTLFFRANRQYVVHINAVENFRSTPVSQVKLELNPPTGEAVLVSKENGLKFQKMDQGSNSF